MTPIKAHWMSEGGVIVRGTDDPAKARTPALRVLMDSYVLTAGTGDVDDWISAALHYARQLRDKKPMENRLWRWTPCSPVSCYDGGGHSGHLTDANRPGRGAWAGVYWTDV